jgi:hypothetical protein
MTDEQGARLAALQQEVAQLGVRVAHLRDAVDAHADLFQSIGALASVFGVNADGDSPDLLSGERRTGRGSPAAVDP